MKGRLVAVTLEQERYEGMPVAIVVLASDEEFRGGTINLGDFVDMRKLEKKAKPSK